MDNFENTNVPPCPDLVKEGLIRQDLTTYEQLVDGYSDPTNIFLKNSFAFNMQQSMLGICTRFKEDVCYTQSLKDEYNTKEAIWLSTLLSCLVDQSKKGYSFTEDDWTHFKQAVVKFTTKRPLYKNEDGHFERNAKHIIDRLMYTAHRTIKNSIDAFHNRLPNPPHWDPDLVTYYKWARTMADTEPQWKILLDDLDKDITALRDEWKKKWPRTSRSFREGEESKSDFKPKVAECYAIYWKLSGLSKNQLLDRLPPAEYQRLAPENEIRSSPREASPLRAYAPIDYAYFPINGVISAMTIMDDGDAIEVATIGNEGIAGLTAFIGGETSPHEVMVQVEGDAMRIGRRTKKEADKDGPLRKILSLYNIALQTQIGYSVACNGLHTIEKRCCRWLLMTQDRIESDVLPLTHEFLSIMLGVRRASVTEVLQPLQEQGLIDNGRGKVHVVNRKGLEAVSCECYRRTKEEFARLFG